MRLSNFDAIEVIAAKLPSEGVTFREFITQVCELQGRPDGDAEGILAFLVAEGINADAKITPGPNRVGLN